MRKPHLGFLALAPRLLEALGARERTGNVSGVFMDVAWYLACRIFRTALRFERTHIAVELAGAIQKCLASCTVPLVPSRFPPGHW